jgi:hypothetical protein
MRTTGAPRRRRPGSPAGAGAVARAIAGRLPCHGAATGGARLGCRRFAPAVAAEQAPVVAGRTRADDLAVASGAACAAGQPREVFNSFTAAETDRIIRCGNRAGRSRCADRSLIGIRNRSPPDQPAESNPGDNSTIIIDHPGRARCSPAAAPRYCHIARIANCQLCGLTK